MISSTVRIQNNFCTQFVFHMTLLRPDEAMRTEGKKD